MLGGAMYAWKRAFAKNGKTPWWATLGATLFATFTSIASLGIGCAVQSSSMTGVIEANFLGIPTWGIGVAVVIMAIPNFIVVLLLSGLITRETKYYVYGDHIDDAIPDELVVKVETKA